MLYFTMNGDEVTKVSDSFSYEAICRPDLSKDYDLCMKIAASAARLTGKEYMVSTAERSFGKEYEVIEAPQVGDKVSYAFNGDSYPDGVIVSITKGTKRIIKTSSGNRYYRLKQRGCWLLNKNWSLIPGHVQTCNPHF
jgi:hypothetical protein